MTRTFLRCRLAVRVPARFKLLYSSMLWSLYARPHARCIRPSSRVTLSCSSRVWPAARQPASSAATLANAPKCPGATHLVILSAPAWIGLRRHQRVTELASSVLHHRHPAVLRGCGVRRVVVCGSQSELHNLVFHGHRCAQFGTGTAGIGG